MSGAQAWPKTCGSQRTRVGGLARFATGPDKAKRSLCQTFQAALACLPVISFDEAISRYSALKMQGYAASTWKANRATIRRFRLWAGGRLPADPALSDVDVIVVSAYFDTLRPPVLSASAFNNYRQHLSLFFDFCVTEGWISVSPVRHVRPARGPRREKLWLRADQVEAMMAGAQPRDRFAIALGFNTGLRAADAMALTVGAVDRKSGYIDATIKKTQKRMRLPLTSDLLVELDRWLEVYLTATGGDGHGNIPAHWLLVPAMHHYAVNVHDPQHGVVAPQPLRRLDHPERIVHRGLALIGLPTHGEGFHTLRRSFARHLYDIAAEAGSRSPIRIVQAHLGHRSQATTEAYLALRPDQVERDDLMRFRRFMP